MPKRDATRSLSLTSQESYKAVIIADMVAEVRSDPEEEEEDLNLPQNGHPKTSEQTNPAFDPYLYTSPPAVVDVELVETTGQPKRNGTTGGSITKGVILNATQFGQPDKLAPDPLKMDRPPKTPEVPLGLKHMSLPRKIAFGVSFLPSIMFVLCFAVFLPCKVQVPCFREVWSNTLDNTVVTSNLVLLRDQVLYTSSAAPSKHLLSSISQSSGSVAWTTPLQSPASFLHCALLENRDSESCLVVDSGRLYLFNSSDGNLKWKKENYFFTSFVGLPDCDGDGLSEVALARSKGQIVTLRHGAILSPVNLTACESVPSALTAWKRPNGTDILLTCRHQNRDKLMKLPQSRWCSTTKKTVEEDILTFESRDSLKGSVLLPTEDGLVLWVEDDVIMFDHDGTQLWKVSSSPHSTDNRFLLHGKFNDSDTHIALFSSSLRNSLRVTTLSSGSGEVAWTKTELNSEVSDVSVVRGKEKDFALLSIRKLKGSLASDALDTMESLSSTIVSVLAKEDVASNSSAPPRMTEETAFATFDDKFLHPIEERELSQVEGERFRSTVTVVSNENVEAETLTMIIQRRSTGNAKDMTTQMRRIDITNWDVSLAKESKCKWRQ